MSIQRMDGNPRMSKVVVHGDTVYLAGMTADKALGQSLAEQTREILSMIDGFWRKPEPTSPSSSPPRSGSPTSAPWTR